VSEGSLQFWYMQGMGAHLAKLRQPFCLPFGNRRLLHCVPSGIATEPYDSDANSSPAGEVPAWEACGKVVKKERSDFYEFVVSGIRSHLSDRLT
jgi:hypothetical protein